MKFAPEIVFAMENIVDDVITVNAEFGERCPDFDPDCCVCQAWAGFDKRARTITRATAAKSGGRVFRVR